MLSNRRHSRNCVTITTVIALAFFMRLWILGVCSLIDTSSLERTFIMVDAVVVGRNSTTFPEKDDDKEYFCPRVEFMSRFGENITVISRIACVLDARTTVIGSIISIRYNPHYPKEFIEEDELEAELTSLKIMLSVGMALSFILSGILLLLLTWHDRHQPQRFLDDIEQFGNVDALDLPLESPEERKERIISKLCFQPVLGDVSNTTAASIRSMKNLDSDTSNPETMDTETGDASKKEKDIDGNYEDEETTREHRADSSELEAKPAASTMSLFSSWMRPAHDVECCICLEQYKAGEVICASKSEKCNHVFHKECLMDWMMKSNHKCPLCRADFMKEA